MDNLQQPDLSALSQAISAEVADRVSADNLLSNALSNEASVRANKDSALSVAIDVVSNAVSVETSNRTSADNALSQAHSVLSQQVSVADAALSVRVDTQSQAVSVLSQQTSALSQAHSALSQAVSLISQALSNEISNRTSADNVVSAQAASIVSQLTSVVSQLNSIVSQGLSLHSQQISVVSQALSNEISNRTSADNAVSAQAASANSQLNSLISQLNSVVSQGLSLNSQQISVLSQAVSVVSTAASNALSVANAASNAASAISQMISAVSARSVGNVSVHGLQSVIDALSNRISGIVAGAASVTSQELSVITAAIQYLSVQNNDAAALSAGMPVYVFTSAGTVKKALIAGTSVQAQVIGLVADGSVAISAVGRIQVQGLMSLTSLQWSEAQGLATSAGLVPGDVYVVGQTAGQIVSSGTNVTTSAWGVRVGVAVDATHMWLQLAPRPSALDALSNAISTVSAAAANTSNNTSIAMVGLSLRIDTMSDKASVASQNLSLLSQQVSVMSTTVSNNASVVSQGLSLLSQGVSVVSQALSNEISNRISGDTSVASQAASATSQLKSVVSQGLSLLSQGISVVSQAHSVLSVNLDLVKFVTLQNQEAAAVSAGCPVRAFTSALTFKKASGNTGVSQEFIGFVADNSIAVSANGRIQVNGILSLTSTQWNDITGAGAGGLVPGSTYYLGTTAGQISTAKPTSPNTVRPVGVALDQFTMLLRPAMVSDQEDAVSNQLSMILAETSNRRSVDDVLSQGISAISQQVSALSQVVSVISAGLGGVQRRVLTGAQVISATAFTNVSGLSLSVQSAATYQIEGRILWTTSILTGTAFGFTFPGGNGVSTGGLQAECITSIILAAPINLVSGNNAVGYAAQGNMSTLTTTLISCLGGASGTTYMLRVHGLLNIAATAGTIQFLAKQSATGGGVQILAGSYLQAFKIQ